MKSSPLKDLKAKPEKDLPFHLLVNFWERASLKGRTKDVILEEAKRLFNRYKEYNLSILPLLRLMLPWLDHEHYYGLKEDSLGKLIIKTLQIPPNSVDAKRISGWKTEGKGDLSEIVEEVAKGRSGVGKELSVSEVADYLDVLVRDKNIMEEIKDKMNPKELKWFCRVILKKLRAKYKDDTLFPIIHPNAQNIFSTNPSLAVIARVFKGEMPPTADVKPGNAVLPMLAMRSNIERLRKQLGDKFKENWLVELKYDGVRMQFHKEGKMMKLFTRSGKDSTKEYAALIPQMAMSLLPDVKSVILDGELLVWNEEENHVEPFSKVRNFAAEAGIGKLPPGRHFLYVIFDLIYLNGNDLTRFRLKRRKVLIKNEVIKKFKPKYIELAPHNVVTSINEVQDLFEQATENEEEGIMLKKESSYYHPNTRDKNWWIKLKPDYQGGLTKDVDLLVVGGFYGEGKRGGKLASFLMAITGKKGADGLPIEYLTIGKVGGGLSEDMLEFLTAEMEQSKLDEKPEIVGEGLHPTKDEKPDFWVAPEDGRVFRINATQVIMSEKFGAGVTFRHPRLEEIRFDKGYMEIMDKGELNEMLEDAPQGIKRKITETKEKKPKKKPLTISRMGPDLTKVEKQSNLLEGLTFQVFIKNDTTKQSIERLIHAYGGKFYQYGQVEWFTHIIAENPNIMAVRNIIKFINDRNEQRYGDYENISADELKDLLRKRREKISGRKEELVVRLEETDKILYNLKIVKPFWLRDTIKNKELEDYTEENTWWQSPVIFVDEKKTRETNKEKKEKRKKSPKPEGIEVPKVKKVSEFKGIKQFKARTRKSPKTRTSPVKKGHYEPPHTSPSPSPPKTKTKTPSPPKTKTPSPQKMETKTPSPPKTKTPSPLKFNIPSPPPKTPSPPKTNTKTPSPPKFHIPSPSPPKTKTKTPSPLPKKKTPSPPRRRIKRKQRTPSPPKTKKNYSKMTVAQLKEELKQQGKSTIGKKADLVKRLEGSPTKISEKTPVEKEEVKKNYSKMTVAQLKEELKQQGKKTTGKKADLVKRLEGSPIKTPVKTPEKTAEKVKPARKGKGKGKAKEVDYSKMKVQELKEELKKQGKPITGKKAELIARLKMK